MVKVEVSKTIEDVANITLIGTMKLSIAKEKYEEIILAQRTSEGSESYYFHYHDLRCEISEAAALELIALGAKVGDLERMKGHPEK